LLQLGVENIQRHRQPLRDEIPRLGFECVTPPGTTSPIITFTTEDGDRVKQRLRRANIDARVARNFVRFSPSVYNDHTDVESVLEALS
jgi:selenocysteine lyase/cysteine desulfurase